jgi:hypothetical protein
MRDFNEKDKKKKKGRIVLPENPANLSESEYAELKNVINSSLKGGYLPCPLGWQIAREVGVPRIAIGEIIDKMGSRVTECQVGCFKVDKTPFDTWDTEHAKRLDEEVVSEIKKLESENQLTCEKVFDIVKKYKLKPMDVSHEINDLGFKITVCQLGCF